MRDSLSLPISIAAAVLLFLLFVLVLFLLFSGALIWAISACHATAKGKSGKKQKRKK